jgi:hypothetical protein
LNELQVSLTAAAAPESRNGSGSAARDRNPPSRDFPQKPECVPKIDVPQNSCDARLAPNLGAVCAKERSARDVLPQRLGEQLLRSHHQD